MPPDPHPLFAALPGWRTLHDGARATVLVLHPSGLWTEFGDQVLGRCWFRTGEVAPDEGEPETWSAIAGALELVVGRIVGQVVVETNRVEGDVVTVEAFARPLGGRTVGLFPVTVYDDDTDSDLYTLDVDSFAAGGHDDDQGDGFPAELVLSKDVGGEFADRALYRRVNE